MSEPLTSKPLLDPSLLMDNAACASQCRELLDDHPTRQAVLLNVYRPLWDEIERLTAELKKWEATVGHSTASWYIRHVVAERDRLRAALEWARDNACGEDCPSCELVARHSTEALAGEDQPRMPPMDSRMRSEVNRGTDETDVTRG